MKTRVYRYITFFLAIIFALFPFASCYNEADEQSNSSTSFDDSTINDVTSLANEESSKEETEKSEASESKEDTVVSFLACPDNIIHPSVYYTAIDRAAESAGLKPSYKDLHNANYDFLSMYTQVAELIKNSDLAYINQETLPGGTVSNISGYPRFNTPMAIVDTVTELGFDVVNVAHNHMLDSGNSKYLENAYKAFSDKNLEVIGYYPNKESTENITVIEIKDIKIAFLSYTYGTNGQRLPSSSEFVIPLFSKELVEKQVRLAKQAADVVVVSCHWGDENTYKPNKEQEEYAKLMSDLEVDVVLGMHPHVIQPMEWMTNESGFKTLVVYSLGNFVSGMKSGANMLGGMLSLNIIKDAETEQVYIDAPTFIPTVTHYTRESALGSHRNYKIYYLTEYTDELAASHGALYYERQNRKTTLVGGNFSKQNLLNTVLTYIPKEFLPKEYESSEIE